jgi:CDP-glycerol glycerophosphotransferase
MLKARILDIAKKHHFVMDGIRATMLVKNRADYAAWKYRTKVNPKMIVFDSFMGRQYSDSPKAIYEYMLSQREYEDYEFVWVAKKGEKKCFPKNSRTKIVEYNSNTYKKVYAEAKYWVSNSRLPEYLSKKRGQIYIQTWHGTPLKKLGFDIEVKGGNAMNTVKDIRRKYASDSKRYDYLISPSDFCTKHFASIFHLEKRAEIIKTLGSPRCDKIGKAKKEEIREIKKALKLPKNKKIILYAPTWRDDQHKSGVGYIFENELDFEKMQEKFGDKIVILFRAHYFIANAFDFKKYKDFVFDVSDYPDINDLYNISDALITDYSSVMFDFAILKRPIFFYMYDLEKYKNKLRGFYFSFSNLPGPISTNMDELVRDVGKYLDRGDNAEYLEKYEKFNKKFNKLSDGRATERVVKEYLNE